MAGDSEYAIPADWVIDSNLALAILAYSMLYSHHQGLAGDSEYATQVDWVIDSNLALAILAYSLLYGRCHIVCVGPVQCCPRAWNLRQYCFFFLLNTDADANMLCRLYDDRKHMDIYLQYTSGILLSWKTKNVFVFFHINV